MCTCFTVPASSCRSSHTNCNSATACYSVFSSSTSILCHFFLFFFVRVKFRNRKSQGTKSSEQGSYATCRMLGWMGIVHFCDEFVSWFFICVAVYVVLYYRDISPLVNVDVTWPWGTYCHSLSKKGISIALILIRTWHDLFVTSRKGVPLIYASWFLGRDHRLCFTLHLWYFLTSVINLLSIQVS